MGHYLVFSARFYFVPLWFSAAKIRRSRRKCKKKANIRKIRLIRRQSVNSIEGFGRLFLVWFHADGADAVSAAAAPVVEHVGSVGIEDESLRLSNSDPVHVYSPNCNSSTGRDSVSSKVNDTSPV